MCYSRSNNKKYDKTGCRGKESAGKESAGEETTTPGGFLRRRCQRRREKAAHPNPPTATTTGILLRNNPPYTANNIPLDPYAFSPDDEADANKKYQFSVMCMMGKDINIPLQLDIEKDAAITALKKKISDRTGGKLALNDMILTLGANVCKRSMTVRQAGIKNNVQIILTLKEDLAKFKVSLSDERDMTQEEVRAALQMVGVAVDVVDDIDPEDKVKSQQKKPYRNADGKAKDRERFTEEEVKALIDGAATRA